MFEEAIPAARVSNQRQPVRQKSPNAQLTLRAILRGASIKETARELTLSPSTVRIPVESVFRKLKHSSRAAATLKASPIGLL